jgi:hypothetical protein
MNTSGKFNPSKDVLISAQSTMKKTISTKQAEEFGMTGLSTFILTKAIMYLI